MQYNREFKTITNVNTIAQMVDAYNNNALTGSDLQFMMGEATFSSVLYTGLETVGNGVQAYKMDAFKDVAEDFTAVYPDNVVLDNWYVYFRPINKFILVSDLHVDLTDYSKYDNNEFVQGDLYHFFLNYELGYRISHSPIPKEGEARLFRFVATESYFNQFIATFPRYFYAGDNVDYVKVLGMDVKASGVASIGTDDGIVLYDGISHDNHAIPDKKYYASGSTEGFEITLGGTGYMVGDVIGTNDVTRNFKVTEVDHPWSPSQLYNPAKKYVADDEVFDNGVMWICIVECTGQEPFSGSTYWRKEYDAGVIVNGELVKDPIATVGMGSGALITIESKVAPWSLLYNTEENKLDYDMVQESVDGSMVMDYVNNTMSPVAPGKFTIQRIHLDYLKNILVMQYGNVVYDTMDEALDAVYSLSFPFVYNTYIFPVLAYMVVRSDYTNLENPDQCQIIQIHTSSTDIRETENLATDSYARSLISQYGKQIQILNSLMKETIERLDNLTVQFNMHITNNLKVDNTILKSGSAQNPHGVTKGEVGLGQVDNVACSDMKVPDNEGQRGKGILTDVRRAINKAASECKSYTDNSTKALDQLSESKYLFKDRNDRTNSGVVTVIDSLFTVSDHMKFKASSSKNNYNENSNGFNWYVGELPPSPPTVSYGVKKSS